MPCVQVLASMISLTRFTAQEAGELFYGSWSLLACFFADLFLPYPLRGQVFQHSSV